MVLNSLGTRFGINDKRGTLVVPELSHEDLAEIIGSSRPMVSKLIGDIIRRVSSRVAKSVISSSGPRKEHRRLRLMMFDPRFTGMVIRNRRSARATMPAPDNL